MHIRKLELHGFKSFPDRTVFHFARGISGVVGPNGCGKSNVVDAVRWCLGEQRPKRLRGQAMADVIFAGSAERGAMEQCEVSLTFEAADDPFPGEYARLDELQVTRRLLRDGSSDYLINGSRVRLKDVQELFLDSGASNPLYSIIEQGRIGEIVRARPEERRDLIEEAAGISRYKLKRREAEQRLQGTRENLERVQDVLGGFTDRLKKLEKQVSAALRHRRLTSVIRQGELLLGLAQFHARTADRRALFEKLRAAEVIERNLTRDVERRDEQTRGDREHEQVLDHLVSGLRAELAELEAERREAEGARSFLHREREELNHRMDGAARRLGLAREERASAQARLSTATGELAEVTEQIGEQEALFEAEREEVRDTEAAARERRRRVEQGRNAVLDRTRERARAQADLEASQGRLIDLEARLEELEGQGDAAGADLDELARQDAQLADEEDGARARSAEAIAAVKGLEAGVRANDESRALAQRALKQAEAGAVDAERAAGRLRARVESLRAVQAGREGVDGDLKRVLAVPGVLGTLAEALDVEERATARVELLLGASLDWVLVRDAAAAEAVARAAGGRLGAVIVGEPSGPAVDVLEGVRATPVGAVALTALLGRPAPAGSLEDALASAAPGAPRWVEGLALVRAAGVVEAGRVGTAGVAVLARKRELAQLSADLEAAEAAELAARAAVDAARVARAAADDEAEAVRAQLGSARAAAAELDLAVKELGRRRQEVARTRQREEERARRIAEARSRSAAQLIELQARIVELTDRAARSLAAIEGLEAELKVEQQALLAEGAAMERARERLGERASHLAALRERRIGLERAQKAEQAAVAQAARVEGEAAAGLDRARGRLAEIEAEDTRHATTLADLTGRQERARARLEEEGARLGAVRERLRVADAERAAAVQKRDEAVSRRMGLAHELEGVKAELNRLRDGLQERHEVSVAGLLDRLDRVGAVVLEADPEARGDAVPESARPPERPEEAVEDLRVVPAMLDAAELLTDWQARVEKARKALSRLGEVNLSALREFDEVHHEHSTLEQQRADLERGVDTIRRTIARLNKISRERFRETFDRVDAYFQELYPRLVGGGKARLSLTDEEDLLEAGVEVYVQPPGKRLQSLSLLSGGETAMVAIALIFSLFRVKPSPFCLLDEVDAPLDEVNGGRFNLMLGEMASLSQFIVITHNKKTMECVDTLYGVTMPSAGISRLVSVRMA